jgi:TPP-dependent pyruvate/acetoin dehydrogenase alpha subunit
VEREIKEIVAFAETSPAPDFSTLYDYTYAEPEHQAMIMPVKDN